MKKKQELLKSVLVLTVICLVVSAALAVVHSCTEPVSAKNAALREDDARRQVLPTAASFEKIEDPALSEDVLSCYKGVGADGSVLGYVILTQGKGFGGTIQVLCAIGPDGTILRCSTLDVSSETPTLGGKTARADYTDQYIGKDASLTGVNAVSQATITSTAYRGCVEEAFRAYELVKEGAHK